MALYHPLPSEVHHNTHGTNAIPTVKPWYNYKKTEMQTWKVVPKVTNVTYLISLNNELQPVLYDRESQQLKFYQTLVVHAHIIIRLAV